MRGALCTHTQRHPIMTCRQTPPDSITVLAVLLLLCLLSPRPSAGAHCRLLHSSSCEGSLRTFTPRPGDDSPFSHIEYLSLSIDVGNGEGEIWFFRNTGTNLAPEYTRQHDQDNPFDGVDVGDFAAPFSIGLEIMFLGNGEGQLQKSGSPDRTAWSFGGERMRR